MDRINNLETYMSELKKYIIKNMEKVIIHFSMGVRYVV